MELAVVDRRIEIEVPPTPMRLEEHNHGVVAVAEDLHQDQLLRPVGIKPC